MTAGERTLCDCPDPCGCYAKGHAAGRERAYFLVLAAPIRHGGEAVGNIYLAKQEPGRDFTQ